MALHWIASALDYLVVNGDAGESRREEAVAKTHKLQTFRNRSRLAGLDNGPTIMLFGVKKV